MPSDVPGGSVYLGTEAKDCTNTCDGTMSLKNDIINNGRTFSQGAILNDPSKDEFNKCISCVNIDARVMVRESFMCLFLRYGFLLGLRGLQRMQKILYPGGFAMLLHHFRSVFRAVCQGYTVREIFAHV